MFGSEVKASARNAGDLGWIPGWGRSPGEGNGSPLQYFCLENPVDGGTWWATQGHKESDPTERLQFHFSLLNSKRKYSELAKGHSLQVSGVTTSHLNNKAFVNILPAGKFPVVGQNHTCARSGQFLHLVAEPLP